jgi:Iap family predicted aminopeptidase
LPGASVEPILGDAGSAYFTVPDHEERTAEMAKTNLKVAPAVETVKPYLDRALNDKEFREDLKEALSAAKKLYGPLVKDARDDGAVKSASRLATDAKMQENLRKALEDFGKAAGSLKGKKKSHKRRNTMLLAGLIAGALYNPWSGPQTRGWLMDKVAGDDDLQPLDGFDLPGADDLEGSAAEATNGAVEPLADAAEKG